MRMFRKKSPGFTLTELLIVVAIIAVLVAVAVPIFTAQLTKAKLAVDMAHFRMMSSYASSIQTLGEVTVGGVTIRPDGSDKAAYLFLVDGTLSPDILSRPPFVIPENAYRAKADSDEVPTHKKDDVLVLMFARGDVTPNVWWIPEDGW